MWSDPMNCLKHARGTRHTHHTFNVRQVLSGPRTVNEGMMQHMRRTAKTKSNMRQTEQGMRGLLGSGRLRTYRPLQMQCRRSALVACAAATTLLIAATSLFAVSVVCSLLPYSAACLNDFAVGVGVLINEQPVLLLR